MRELELFDMLEKDAEVLRRISTSFPDESAEAIALKHAASALVYVVMNDGPGFIQCLQEATASLTDEQKEYLRSIGSKYDEPSDV